MHSEAAYVRNCLEAGARGYLLKNAMDLELVDAVKEVAAGRQVLDPRLGAAARQDRRRAADADAARTRGAATDRERQVEQGYRRRARAEREYRGRTPREYHAGARNSQYGGAGGLRHPQRTGEHRVTRRTFLLGARSAAAPRLAIRVSASPMSRAPPGIDFQHNSGAFGAKYLPETMGPGCAFLDYDGDGWLDILLVNGCDWPGHKRQRSTPASLPEQSQRHVHAT